jgi:hypothetical protein
LKRPQPGCATPHGCFVGGLLSMDIEDRTAVYLSSVRPRMSK